MTFDMTQPCPKCPFRSDITPFLNKRRAKEIGETLLAGQATFACHQTTKHDDDGEHVNSEGERHCAGALIVLERMGKSTQMMRICERIGCYDHRKLNMDAPVFNTMKEFEKAQPRR